jgi:sodium/hydrogen exchanger 8
VALVLFNSLSKVLVADANNGLNLVHEIEIFVIEFSVIALGSPVLGIIFSFFTALIFKKVDFREHKSIELCLYILLMYIPYMLAEVFHLSGIVTVFFSGMSARRYIEPNISPETAKNAEAVFKSIAYLAETCIFLILGLSCFGYVDGFQWKFIGFAFLASLVGRALSIYPISIIYNCSLRETVTDSLLDLEDDVSVGSSGSTVRSGGSRRRTPERRKDREIPARFMHVLWFAGLRGAVAYACAKNFPNVYGHENDFVTATMVIVLLNVLVMGGFTEYLLNFLNIRMGVDETEYMRTWRKQRKLKGTFHRLGKFYSLVLQHLVRVLLTDMFLTHSLLYRIVENEYIYKTVVRRGSEDGSTTPAKPGYENPEWEEVHQEKLTEFVQIHHNSTSDLEGRDDDKC